MYTVRHNNYHNAYVCCSYWWPCTGSYDDIDLYSWEHNNIMVLLTFWMATYTVKMIIQLNKLSAISWGLVWVCAGKHSLSSPHKSMCFIMYRCDFLICNKDIHWPLLCPVILPSISGIVTPHKNCTCTVHDQKFRKPTFTCMYYYLWTKVNKGF